MRGAVRAPCRQNADDRGLLGEDGEEMSVGIFLEKIRSQLSIGEINEWRRSFLLTECLINIMSIVIMSIMSIIMSIMSIQ